MKTKASDDGMNWLRDMRQRVAVECGFDLAKQAARYRQAAAKHTYRAYHGEAAIVGKRRLKLAA